MARPGERGYGHKLMATEMAENRKRWQVMIRAGTLRSGEAERCEVRRRITCRLALRPSHMLAMTVSTSLL